MFCPAPVPCTAFAGTNSMLRAASADPDAPLMPPETVPSAQANRALFMTKLSSLGTRAKRDRMATTCRWCELSSQLGEVSELYIRVYD